MDIQKTIKSLERGGYQVSFFQTGEEAVKYLEECVESKTIGFGGSRTLTDLHLLEVLSKKNRVLAPDFPEEGEDNQSTAMKSINTDYYFLSANGLSENGEIVNIDATGNRLAGSLYGHQKVFYIIGTNKIEENLDRAIWRARNIAAPKNAKRFHLETACAMSQDKCFDCKGAQRICNTMLIHFMRPRGCEAEVVLINEELGF